jgi:3-oxoacyl-[acyl-carrier protein] reductase
VTAVLVTGGASGIGRATALRVAAAGHGVAVGTFAGDPYAADAVVAEIESAGGRAPTRCGTGSWTSTSPA